MNKNYLANKTNRDKIHYEKTFLDHKFNKLESCLNIDKYADFHTKEIDLEKYSAMRNFEEA